MLIMLIRLFFKVVAVHIRMLMLMVTMAYRSICVEKLEILVMYTLLEVRMAFTPLSFSLQTPVLAISEN